MNEASKIAHQVATREHLRIDPETLALRQACDLMSHYLSLRRLGVLSWRQVFAKTHLLLEGLHG